MLLINLLPSLWLLSKRKLSNGALLYIKACSTRISSTNMGQQNLASVRRWIVCAVYHCCWCILWSSQICLCCGMVGSSPKLLFPYLWFPAKSLSSSFIYRPWRHFKGPRNLLGTCFSRWRCFESNHLNHFTSLLHQAVINSPLNTVLLLRMGWCCALWGAW